MDPDAFQIDAFENDAFQVGGGVTPVPPPTSFSDVFAPRQNLTGKGGASNLNDVFAKVVNITGAS